MNKLKYPLIAIILIVLLSLVYLSIVVSAKSTAIAPGLGVAESFAVAGGSTVTNTGSSVINGDLGVWPGLAITGFPPGIVVPPGTTHAGDAVAQQAKSDITTAYNALAGQACDVNLTGQDLGGLTLTPGVYCFSSSAGLTGSLTLNAQGDPNAVFVFQIGSSLTTASNSSVLMINSSSACNVFWQVGSSATIGTTTDFQGNILALTSITMNTGAKIVAGRALARNGAVTLDTNNISSTVCSSQATPLPATQTVIVATQTIIAPTLTSIAMTPTQTLPPPTQTAIAATQTAIAATHTAIAPSLTAQAATLAPLLTAQAATQTATALTPRPTNTPTSAPTSTNTPTSAPTNTNTPAFAPTSTKTPQGFIPSTGFAPQRVTFLSKQPVEKAYADLGELWLEIPRMDVKIPIVGVPQQANGEWDVSWLGNQAGWLNGTAFPTWSGNSVLTGHVVDALGKPGPFLGLNGLVWGDKVIVHASGAQYVYEVRKVTQVKPEAASSVFKHEELPWVTLITCRGYDAASNSYKYRVVVRAVLVEVK